MTKKTKKPVRSKRPRGRVPGVSVPSSEKNTIANRTKGWKHGLYAQVVSAADGRRAQLEEKYPDAAVLFDAYEQALKNDDLSAIDPISITGIVETQLIRRAMVGKIMSGGVMLERVLVDKKGEVVGSIPVANPLIEPLIKINEQVGVTAQDLRLSRKSRGEGERDDAIARALLQRDQLLREMAQAGNAPPPPPPKQLTDGSK